MKRVLAPPAPDRFDRDLPIAAILDDFLARNRKFVGAWIGEGERKDQAFRDPIFHFSGAGCLRKDVLEITDAPQIPRPGTSARTFAIGSVVEAVLEAALLERGMVLARQFKLWRDWAFRAGRGHRRDLNGKLILDDCLVVGTLDWIVRWPAKGPDYKVFLLDGKSVHPGKFDYLDQEEDAGYCTQQASYVSTYLDTPANLKPYDGPIHEARLVYVSKADGRIKQVGVDLDKWIPIAWTRWRNQRAAFERNQANGALPDELPFTAAKDPHWKCDPRYCGFAVARRADGAPVCPVVNDYWTKRADAAIKRGGDLPYFVEAVALAESNGHDEAEQPEAEGTDVPVASAS